MYEDFGGGREHLLIYLLNLQYRIQGQEIKET